MEDFDSRLNKWIVAHGAAKAHFAAATTVVAGDIDIQGAAVAKLGIADPVELLDRDWTATELIELLRDVDFDAWADFEDVSLHDSILPPGTPRRLDEETIKQNGEQWRIHAYDPDPFPSLPHAHNLSSGLKLDLRNGSLYRKRVRVGHLERKELMELRGRVRRIALPALDAALAT